MLDLKGFKLDLRHNDRVNEILDAYRIKLTGSLDCRNDADLYGFIYKHQPYFLTEILMIMYQIGYEDGQKKATRRAMPLFTRQDEEQVVVRRESPSVYDKVPIKLVIDNTKKLPQPEPFPVAV